METELEEKLSQVYRNRHHRRIAAVLAYAAVVELVARLTPAVEPPVDRATQHLFRQVFRGLSLASFLLLAWLLK